MIQIILQNFFSFIFIISILVFIHEFGHFFVARRCGVAIDEFSIGFGREIIGFTDKKGTRWKVCLIPLGGYVKMYGDKNGASMPDDEKAAKKNFIKGADDVLVRLYEQFVSVGDWQSEILHQIVVNLSDEMALNLGKVAQPLRVAVCGSGVSPAIDVTLALLGREKILFRIQRAITYCRSLNLVGLD